MADTGYGEMVQEVIEENGYLALSTTDGTDPWVATIEYIYDDSGTFYFFSTTDSRHAQHIENNETVGVAIWSAEQPEYSPDVSTSLNGVQIRGEAHRLAEDEYPQAVVAAIEALDPPMPPYAAFEIVTHHAYAPVIEDGVNKRVEVDIG